MEKEIEDSSNLCVWLEDFRIRVFSFHLHTLSLLSRRNMLEAKERSENVGFKSPNDTGMLEKKREEYGAHVKIRSFSLSHSF